MKKNLLLFFTIAFIFLMTGCSFNKNSKNDDCCECKDCPQCDVCCSCDNPYLNK